MTKYVYLPSGEILSHEEWETRRAALYRKFWAFNLEDEYGRLEVRPIVQQEHSVLSPE